MTTNIILNPATNKTAILSIAILISFLIALVVGAYMFSLADNKIDKDRFTISQALAYGNKPIMITFFIISLILTLYLNYLRGGPAWSLYLRYLFFTLAYAFVIVIIYVTTEKNKELHFRFAGTTFTLLLINVLVISYLFNYYLKERPNLITAIDYNIILIVISFVLLAVFGVFDPNDNSEFRNIIFASNENITVFLNLLPTFYLGFI